MNNPRPILLLVCALQANGPSSYRDARNLLLLSRQQSAVPPKDGGGGGGGPLSLVSHVKIITDIRQTSGFDFSIEKNNEKEKLSLCATKADFLMNIEAAVVQFSVTHDILFALSAHGYSMAAVAAAGSGSTIIAAKEADGRDEYLRIGVERCLDDELTRALCSKMHASCLCWALTDTCHSGTMLDLAREIPSTATASHTAALVVRQNGPHVICVSACSDSELDGEDISEFGGWGGRLVCAFLDYATSATATSTTKWKPLEFYRLVVESFADSSHPVLSCTAGTLSTAEIFAGGSGGGGDHFRTSSGAAMAPAETKHTIE